jgi:hypothetical protein
LVDEVGDSQLVKFGHIDNSHIMGEQ